MKRPGGHPVRVAAAGSFLPGEPLGYDDIDSVLGPFTEPTLQRAYQRSREVMRELLAMDRYYFAVDPVTRQITETPSSMAAKAARRALDAAGMQPSDVDLLVYAGSSQDRFICPPTSVFVQEHLGIERCAELSFHANCTATYKAIQVAADQIALGRYRTALITSSNLVSGSWMAEAYTQAHMNRAQAMMRLFLCDGAGAILLTRDDGAGAGLEVWDTYLESVGCHKAPRMTTRFGSASLAPQAIAAGDHHVEQDLGLVGREGVEVFLGGFVRFATQLGMTAPDFRERVSHVMANVPSDHLVDAALEDTSLQYDLPLEHLRQVYYSTVAGRGYTGPAAVLISLDELLQSGALQDDRFVISFVTESSKWMNAGFLLRHRAA